MKIAVRLFLSSMVFGIAIASAYWIATHDIVGVLFLGTMAIALIVVATYIVVAEREANLAGDDAALAPADVAGEALGVFSFESYWPILAALGVTLLFAGVVFLPGVSLLPALVGAALLAWTLRFMLREST